MTAPRCCDLHNRNCEPPSELCCWECTEARHAGWTDDRGRSRYGHPAGEQCSAPDLSPLTYGEAMNRLYSDPGHSRDEWDEAAGAFLSSMLGGTEPEPGPPYTHTIVPPDPIGWDEDGNPLYPEPGPAMTLTEARKCPVHGTDMFYAPAHDDYACQDVTCRYGHGGG